MFIYTKKRHKTPRCCREQVFVHKILRFSVDINACFRYNNCSEWLLMNLTKKRVVFMSVKKCIK